jgi:Putative DNA-binding domain
MSGGRGETAQHANGLLRPTGSISSLSAIPHPTRSRKKPTREAAWLSRDLSHPRADQLPTPLHRVYTAQNSRGKDPAVTALPAVARFPGTRGIKFWVHKDRSYRKRCLPCISLSINRGVSKVVKPFMKIIDITTVERARLLAIEEDHFSDLKGKDIKPGKVTDSVSAFANAGGGDIYIGIEEIDKAKKLRSWDGFDTIESANAHIQTIEQMAPLANHFTYEFLRCEKSRGLVLHLSIHKSKDVIAASSGKIYVRKSWVLAVLSG